MGKFFTFAVLFSSLASASPNFWSEARRAVDDTWFRLYQCGMSRMSPYDPRLPQPRVPAREAIVNRSFRLLAYYDEEWFGGYQTLVFKNPNGSQRHTVHFSDREINFVTPTGGSVASARQLNSVGGPYTEFRCRNYVVSEFEWRSCVNREYVDWIGYQICRYPYAAE